MDYASKKFFGKDIVILKPNSDAIIDGRKFKVTFDLKEALRYVKNNNIKSTKPTILIDDLELWRDKDVSLLNNIRALIHFIETESENAFVMVSVSSIMCSHLNNRLNFTDVFSHIINVNLAEIDELVEAVLLRHGAAHRDLISEDSLVISHMNIRAIAKKLSKKSNYNFGNTLQSWTYNTFVLEDDNVLFKTSQNEFLDFFNMHEAIILKQALTFKYITEVGLKRVTSIDFEKDYSSTLRRLTNFKVLMRDNDGKLYINPVVINDVARIITNKVNI